MSERNVDQYSVLTWVWHVARTYEDDGGIPKFRELVKHVLGNISKSGAIDFDKLLSEFKRGLW